MTEAQRLSARSCVTVNGNGSTLSCRKRSIATRAHPLRQCAQILRPTGPRQFAPVLFIAKTLCFIMTNH